MGKEMEKRRWREREMERKRWREREEVRIRVWQETEDEGKKREGYIKNKGKK